MPRANCQMLNANCQMPNATSLNMNSLITIYPIITDLLNPSEAKIQLKAEDCPPKIILSSYHSIILSLTSFPMIINLLKSHQFLFLTNPPPLYLHRIQQFPRRMLVQNVNLVYHVTCMADNRVCGIPVLLLIINSLPSVKNRLCCKMTMLKQ